MSKLATAAVLRTASFAQPSGSGTPTTPRVRNSSDGQSEAREAASTALPYRAIDTVADYSTALAIPFLFDGGGGGAAAAVSNGVTTATAISNTYGSVMGVRRAGTAVLDSGQLVRHMQSLDARVFVEDGEKLVALPYWKDAPGTPGNDPTAVNPSPNIYQVGMRT